MLARAEKRVPLVNYHLIPSNCARYRVATSDGLADGLGRNTRKYASMGIRDIPATLLLPTSWCLRLMHPHSVEGIEGI